MDQDAEASSGSRSKLPPRMLGIVPLLLVIWALAGCSMSLPAQPPTAAEIDRVKAHQLAVVLFQLKANIDAEAVTEANPGSSDYALRLYLANLDELSAPNQVVPAWLSQAPAGEGWRYLLLPPGVYYLLVLPPGGRQNPPALIYHARSGKYGRLTQYKFEPGRGGFVSSGAMAYVLSGAAPADFRELEGFWFQVPENGEVVYLGSLAIACRTGRGLFGSLVDSCSDYEVTSDPEAARRAVASSLPGLTVDALPLVRYGKHREGARLRDLGTMDVFARPPTRISAAITGAEMAPFGGIAGTGTGLAVVNLLVAGIEAAERAVLEQHAEARLAEAQPCIARLADTVGTIDYAARFLSALKQSAREQGIAQALDRAGQSPDQARGESARYRLTASLPILRLREVGDRQHWALELALELRLEAVDSKQLKYYEMLRFGPELPLLGPHVPGSPLYSQLVPQRPTPRPVSEWCGGDGPRLLREEISAALTHIAARAAQDLD